MHECKECKKEFSSNESLDSHVRDKHKVMAKNIFFKFKKSYVISFLIVVVLTGLGMYGFISAGRPGELDDFAKCLTDNNVKFYGAFWCSHCATQKKLFGKSIDFVNYIECSTSNKREQIQVCIDANIKGYPTWEFKDGTRVTGALSIKELGSRSGCELK